MQGDLNAAVDISPGAPMPVALEEANAQPDTRNVSVEISEDEPGEGVSAKRVKRKTKSACDCW